MHPIQEKKITIKAFNKLKSTVYKLDRDNVGKYLIFDNIEPIKTIDLDENHSIDNHIFREHI
jgi:hypothetical protein